MFPLSLVPLLPFTMTFIIGILLHGCGVAPWWVLAVAMLAGGMVVFRWNYPALMCVGVLVGYAVGYAHEPAVPSWLSDSHERAYSAVVIDVKSYEPTQVVIAEIDSCNGMEIAPLRVKLTVPSSIPEVNERDRIRFSSILEPIRSTADLPGEMDFNASLRRKGVRAEVFLNPDSLRVLYPEPGILNSIRRFRTDVTLAIIDLPVSSQAREFINATLTADRSMLTSDVRELFSSTGLSHLLALSGLHVAIIAGVITVILFPLVLLRLRWLRTLMAIIFLWGFAVMTGLTPSVVRSVVMATIFFITYSIQRQRSPLNSLCVAALLILVFSPSSIYEVGFQLSFLAVASILLFAEKLNPFPRRKSLLYGFAAYPSVTLAAMLGTAVVSAFYFNLVPLTFLPANFIGALLLPPILAGSVILLVFNVFGFHCGFLAVCVDRMFDILYSSAGWLNGLPMASLTDVYISGFTLFACFMTLLPFALWLYKKRMVYILATLVCIIFTVSTSVLADSDHIDGTEMFIPRSRQHTSLLIRDASKLHILTSAPQRMHEELRDDYTVRYRRYLLTRKIDSLQFRTASSTIVDAVAVDGRRFALICSSRQLSALERGLTADSSCRHLDYAVVCNGFRGDVVRIAELLRADSILLSADLNTRLHSRYHEALTEGNFNVRSLKNSPFVMQTERSELMM